MNFDKLYVYDIETYKELFSFSIVRADGKHKKTFEVSKFSNQIEGIFKCLDYLRDNDCYLVGFNSLQFDWPIMQKLVDSRNSLPKSGDKISLKVFDLAQKQIDSFKENQFGNTVKTEDEYIRQIDLFKIHHFDNKNKSTSLKMIEFNLRLESIVDLPYGIEESLDQSKIEEILRYNEHDVEATRVFLEESKDQVLFRFQLTEKYNKSFLNHNDGKIGKDYFKMKLTDLGMKLSEYKNGKLVMKQSPRPSIKIGDCLFGYYDFKRQECKAVLDWFSKQVITETKGVFSDIEEHNLGEVAQYAEMIVKRKKFKAKPTESELNEFKKEHPLGWIEEEELKATEYAFDSDGNHIMEQPLDEDGSPDFSKKPKKKRIPKKSYWGCWRMAETLNIVLDGLRVDFGVGGVHASLSNKVATETKRYIIRDADCASMYPNIAISNNVFPEHLGVEFCDIYQDVYEQRKSYPKGSAENSMLKLSLNSVFGDSNNKYSNFYDPVYTMKITVNGQLSLLLLAEKLLEIKGMKLIQLNTDGLTVAMLRDTQDQYYEVCKAWEKQVGLQLEYADYSKMIIRDVNNYIALYTNGKVKRKGAYQYEGLGWYQNQGGLVIPMAAEAYMLKGIPVDEFIKNHGNVFDFMLRTKVPRSSRLILQYDDREELQQNICRYYISNNGGKLIKIMPALEEGGEERRLSIDSEWKVKTCNNMLDFDGDINYNYYISEAKKLVIE